MSYRRRHRWFRRMAFGLAFASVMFAGRVSVAAAKVDEGPDPQSLRVIPYLSHGILTEADAQLLAAEAIHDPFPSDIAFANAVVAAAESLHDPIGPGEQASVAAAVAIHDRYPSGSTRLDGDTIAIRNAIEAQRLASAEAIRDPYPSLGSTRPDGDTIAIRNAIEAQLLAAAEAIRDPYVSPGVLGEAVKTNLADVKFVAGVTDFPTAPQQVPDNRVERALEQGPQVIPYFSQGMTSDDVVGVRPDDRADRFAHSDVQTPVEVSSSGSTFEWNDALTVGFGALVLALGLGLALGYLRRPRLAGL